MKNEESSDSVKKLEGNLRPRRNSLLAIGEQFFSSGFTFYYLLIIYGRSDPKSIAYFSLMTLISNTASSIVRSRFIMPANQELNLVASSNFNKFDSKFTFYFSYYIPHTLCTLAICFFIFPKSLLFNLAIMIFIFEIFRAIEIAIMRFRLLISMSLVNYLTFSTFLFLFDANERIALLVSLIGTSTIMYVQSRSRMLVQVESSTRYQDACNLQGTKLVAFTINVQVFSIVCYGIGCIFVPEQIGNIAQGVLLYSAAVTTISQGLMNFYNAKQRVTNISLKYLLLLCGLMQIILVVNFFFVTALRNTFEVYFLESFNSVIQYVPGILCITSLVIFAHTITFKLSRLISLRHMVITGFAYSSAAYLFPLLGLILFDATGYNSIAVTMQIAAIIALTVYVKRTNLL